MRKPTVLICDLARVLYGGAVFYWFFIFLVIISGIEGVRLSPAVPALGLAAVYAAGFICSGKGMAFWHYAAVQTAVTAAGAVLLICVLGRGPADLKLKIFSAVVYVITAGIGAGASAAEIKPQSLTIRFDCCVVMCTIMLLAGNRTQIALLPSCMIMMLLSMAAIAVSLVVLRAEDRGQAQGLAGRALPFVLLLLIGLISLAAYYFAAGGAQKLTEALVAAAKAVLGAIGSALVFLWTQWTRFCAWLASLFPQRDFVPDLVPQEQTDLGPVPEATEPSRFAAIVAWVMTALLVLLIAVAVYYALRSIRLRRRDRLKLDNRKAVRRGGLGEGIRDALAGLYEKLRYRFACVRYRNTAAGLLAWCEYKVPRAERCRRGESPRAFLTRIAGGMDEEEAKALNSLAALVEKDLYGREKQPVSAGLKAAVRRCRF